MISKGVDWAIPVKIYHHVRQKIIILIPKTLQNMVVDQTLNFISATLQTQLRNIIFNLDGYLEATEVTAQPSDFLRKGEAVLQRGLSKFPTKVIVSELADRTFSPIHVKKDITTRP